MNLLRLGNIIFEIVNTLNVQLRRRTNKHSVLLGYASLVQRYPFWDSRMIVHNASTLLMWRVSLREETECYSGFYLKVKLVTFVVNKQPKTGRQKLIQRNGEIKCQQCPNKQLTNKRNVKEREPVAFNLFT